MPCCATACCRSRRCSGPLLQGRSTTRRNCSASWTGWRCAAAVCVWGGGGAGGGGAVFATPLVPHPRALGVRQGAARQTSGVGQGQVAWCIADAVPQRCTSLQPCTRTPPAGDACGAACGCCGARIMAGASSGGHHLRHRLSLALPALLHLCLDDRSTSSRAATAFAMRCGSASPLPAHFPRPWPEPREHLPLTLVVFLARPKPPSCPFRHLCITPQPRFAFCCNVR